MKVNIMVECDLVKLLIFLEVLSTHCTVQIAF